jgi:uncharacterized protein
MKLFLFLLALLVLLWLLRRSFTRSVPPRSGKRAPEEPEPMLACAQCGVHLPRHETLPGRGGVFCGPAHRAAFELAHPE